MNSDRPSQQPPSTLPKHHHLPIAVTLVLITLTGTVGIATAQEKDKHPVPDAAAQQAALKLVREVFKPDYDAAKTSEEKLALAKKMLDLSRTTKDDPTGRYVLLRIAKDMAAAEGDLELVETAVGEIAKFAVDELELRAEALAATANNVRSKEDQEKVVDRSLGLIDQVVQADRYSLLKPLEDVALAAVRQLRDGELLKRVQARMNDAEQAEEAHAQVADALAELEQRPTDPEANLAVGRFYCFIKGDWEKGLPMLALGNDPATADPARRELQESPDPVALGDAWWELADKLEDRPAAVVRQRAAMHYRKALPNLTGLTKARVQANLATYTASLYPGREKPLDLRGKKANGFLQLSVVSCAQKAHQAEMGPTFDPTKNWSLDVEFLAPHFRGDLQMIVQWGDGRPGRDPLLVRLRHERLEWAWGDARDNGFDNIFHPVSESDAGQWQEVQLDYDHRSNSFFAYWNSQLIAVRRSNVISFADRPMPIWIGGISPVDQRFTGSVRKIWLGNTD